MDDAIRLNAETFRHYFAQGYRTWQRLCLKAAGYHEFPADLVDFEHACPRAPYLHDNLELKPGYNFHATGTWTWHAGKGDDGCDLRPFQRSYSIPPSPERFPTWFGGERNHVGILTLAWAYVLSARWAEVVPGATALHYTDSQAVFKQPGTTTAGGCLGEIPVDLRPASDSAARWWAALLAPSQGWTTGISHSGSLLPAPWSTNLAQAANAPFVLLRTSTTAAPPPHLAPPSFSVAASYILAYSAHHRVRDQSRAAFAAAFAAALMLPTAGRIKQTISFTAAPSASPVPEQVPVWGRDVRQLDRLLTLSCNNFIRSLLSSAVFEPDMACNACGAWIQGAFAILDQAKSELQVLTGALMTRNPGLGFLWLGAALLGIHDSVLNGMRALFYPVGLTLAGWTDTRMSFIQEPVRGASPAKGTTITRADEARLLFLSQSMEHTQPPIVPFGPFGLANIADCNLEVQAHARCRSSSHGLCYSGWTWDWRDGARAPTPQDPSPPLLLNGRTLAQQEGGGEQEEAADGGGQILLLVDYSQMDRENDGSEAVTRNTFMWLRGADGFPVAERELRQHEWIDNLEESDDDMEGAAPEGDWRSIGALRSVNVGPGSRARRWRRRTGATAFIELSLHFGGPSRSRNGNDTKHMRDVSVRWYQRICHS
ncbi:hypothetical protein C8A01DRAFT_43833 [Parachaetomium inaequale]|uniref:Uncharacterized protein n=1 Tax=Parachaetomium inaequale TaxID=2588326 RepID=A0AAN6PLU3_9PEZI|nr:hypothetical protein C8A01DRAFT_43833 [Parachaetomium inaequale]